MKNSSGEVIVDFGFLRVGRLVIAAGALVLVPSVVVVPSAQAKQAAAAQPNWKDRDEYDLFTKAQQATDPKARLAALQTWQDKYPTTDFVDMRNQYFLDTYGKLAGTDPAMRTALLAKAQDALKTSPNNPNALYMICLWGPINGGSNPTPDQISQVESAGHTLISTADDSFSDAKKPQATSADAWKGAKFSALAKAHQALAWADISKKDLPDAEKEYRDSLTSNPEDGQTSSLYGKLLFDEKKYDDSLFEYARAGQYTGPGPSLPPAGRQTALDFFNKTYKNYHGSDEGKDQVLAAAKTSALPPAGFKITSAQGAADDAAKAINDRIAKDPGFGLWYGVKQKLTSDDGAAYFDGNVKGAELPGGANGVKTFSGTILTLDPADKPTRMTVGIEDPAKADATILFTTAVPAEALNTLKVGATVNFTAVAESYTKDPFMLTFRDPEIPGVKLATPPAKSHKKH